MLAALMVMLLALAPSGAGAGSQSSGFQLVVHASSARTSVPKADLARIFLRKSRTWPGGGGVEPVDQKDDAAVRQAFSKAVLDKDVAAVKSYWQQQVFTGKGAPLPVHAGDAAVLAHVAKTPNAVGYVSAGTAIPDGVKTITVVP